MLNLARKTRVFYFESVLSLKSVLNFIAIQKSIGFWRKLKPILDEGGSKNIRYLFWGHFRPICPKLKPIDDDRGSKNIRYPFWALF